MGLSYAQGIEREGEPPVDHGDRAEPQAAATAHDKHQQRERGRTDAHPKQHQATVITV